MSSSMSCKCCSYTAKLKLNAIKLTKINGNLTAAREMDADEKIIKDW